MYFIYLEKSETLLPDTQGQNLQPDLMSLNDRGQGDTPDRSYQHFN